MALSPNLSSGLSPRATTLNPVELSGSSVYQIVILEGVSDRTDR